MLTIGMSVLVFLTTAFYQFAALQSLRSVQFVFSDTILRKILCYGMITVLGMAMIWLAIPLPLFYILIYLVGCTILLPYSNQKHKILFVINIRFLLFTSTHLIVLGILALLAGSNVKGVLDEFVGRGISVTGTLFDFGVSMMIDRQKNLIWNFEGNEFKLLAQSMWFWMGFVLIDSIPSMFWLPATLVSLFLIGSNLLLLLMLVFFCIHVYRITQNAHLEEENFYLLLEEQRQRSRTAFMEKEAYTDKLTGAYTRTYVLHYMHSLVESGDPFSMVFIDLDSLKQVNDTQGHLAGDYYLKTFALEIRSKLRGKDILARIGGDEFLVLMLDCELEITKIRLNSIREELENNKTPGMPFSFGVVYVPSHPDKRLAEYLDEADQLMYENKQARRC